MKKLALVLAMLLAPSFAFAEVQSDYFTATSTTATSTLNGNLKVDGNSILFGSFADGLVATVGGYLRQIALAFDGSDNSLIIGNSGQAGKVKLADRSGSGDGGFLEVSSSNADTSGVGGTLYVYAGNGGSGSGDGGYLGILGGAALASNFNGGTVSIVGGDGGPGGSGGVAAIEGGGSTVQSSAGLFLAGGNNADYGTIGSALLSGADSQTSEEDIPGGDVILQGGERTGTAPFGHVKIMDPSGSFSAIFETISLTADRTYTFPDESGVFGLLEADQEWEGENVFSQGASGTTTITVGDLGSGGSTACFNTKNTAGADISFYFVGTSMVVEANTCQ